jgi:hypothetical protein
VGVESEGGGRGERAWATWRARVGGVDLGSENGRAWRTGSGGVESRCGERRRVWRGGERRRVGVEGDVNGVARARTEQDEH